MNNKGFAITTILYGTLILFLMLLISLLGILSSYKDRLSLLIDSNNGARDIINGNFTNIGNDVSNCTLSANDMTITASISNTSGLVYYGFDSSYSGSNTMTTTINGVGTYSYYMLDSFGNRSSCSATVEEINAVRSCIGVYHSTYGMCVGEDELGLHCYISDDMCMYWRGEDGYAIQIGPVNTVYSCGDNKTKLNDNYCFVSNN